MGSFARFINNLNRLLTPLHALKTEQEIDDFFANSTEIYHKDFITPLFKKSEYLHRLQGDLKEEFEQVV